MFAYSWGKKEEHYREYYETKEVRCRIATTDTGTTCATVTRTVTSETESVWTTKIITYLVEVWYAYPQYAIGYWSEPFNPAEEHFVEPAFKPKIEDERR